MEDTQSDFKICLKKVLKIAYNHVQACTGADEIIKSLIREETLELVVLARDLTQKYQDVIMGLCQKANVPVVFVEDRKEMAEIFPLKVKKAGAAAVKNFMKETDEKRFILASLK